MAKKPTAVEGGPAESRGLPTGTVTFLFTDIEGSTRLLRTTGESYGTALADHRRMLRTAFAAHGGREVDTQGDSFFVAFPRASDAVAAAVQAQRALAAGQWPAGVHLLVRMGLHTGEATLVGDGYVGLAVHRAARVAAAAHGGQVLLSDTTAALIADALPDDTALRSLGAHQLKDFPRPAPVFQLDIIGLRTQFPPLRTLPRERALPMPNGSLLGRDADVSALASVLRDEGTRLVTVTGPGGIGKTRLAVEAARIVADDFPGGVVFVPLSTVSDPRLVLSTIAEAVDAGTGPGIDVIIAVRSALGEDRNLLILDNFEHVAVAASDLARILDGSPATVGLVTSRQSLRLRAEHRFPLAQLAATPAEQLFAERAAAVRPDFALDAKNSAAVAEICRRLDRLPLAIELAAARVRLLPPETLLALLSERLDVIGGGLVDLPERQRTLRATMDWSFGLLGPHEQAVFTRLAVFSGGWTLPAAETVCGRPDEPGVLEAVSALLDASLLVEPDDSSPDLRLNMLETVHAYAVEKLADAPERSATERRHTGWVMAMTDPKLLARPHGFQDALERFDRDRANVRAAIQRVVDAGDIEAAALLIGNVFPFLLRRDGAREALAWLDQILPLSKDARRPVHGSLLILRAAFSATLGEFVSARPLLDEAELLVPDDAEHAVDRVRAAMAGMIIAVAEGAVDEASRYVDETATRFAALGQDLGLAYTEMTRGDLALLRGDAQASEPHYRAALELSARHGDETMIGQVLSSLGLISLARGDITGGRRAILDAATVNRHSGQPSNFASSLEGLAAIALTDDHPVVAARALAAAAVTRRNAASATFPELAPLVEDLVTRARVQLGDKSYEAAWEEGSHWSAQQALDRTLAELPDAERPSDSGAGTRWAG